MPSPETARANVISKLDRAASYLFDQADTLARIATTGAEIDRATRKRRAALQVDAYAIRCRNASVVDINKAEMIAHAALMDGILIASGMTDTETLTADRLADAGHLTLVTGEGIPYYSLTAYLPA